MGTPYYPQITITPNLGLSLVGMDEVIAQDFILIDAFAGGGGPGAVSSVFGRTGAVVANTGDYSVAQITGAAPLASPGFTGVPTAPTASLGTNTTQLATTAFVIANAGSGAVSSVFGRTGAVVANSGDYSVAQVTGAAPLASPAFTGTPTAPTPATGNNSTLLATTAFVKAQGYGTGTVTSVALGADSGAILVVSGSPVTASGTLQLQFSTQAANVVLAGPTTGSAAAPTFRALVTADLPAGTGTVTSVAQSFTGGLISVSGSPITTSGTLALTVAGTSGGIPYFSSTSAWASSALLASGGVVLGGGAGTAPSTNTHLTFATNTLTVGLAGTGSGILALAGSTSGSATITAPTTAGTVTNPIAFSNSLQLPSGTVYNWNADTGLSRDSAGVIDVGNGTAADKSGSLNLTGITMTGVLSNSLSPAVSQSAVTLSGAPQTGGSGTTNFPLLYLNTTGASAPTTFSTAGTFFGINAASGFAGVFLDLRVNGTQNFSLSNAGNIVTQGTLAVTGATQLTGTVSGTGITSLFASPPAIGGTSASTGAFTSLTTSSTIAASAGITGTSITASLSVGAGATQNFVWSGRSKMQSPADGVILFGNNAVTGFTRLDFGGTTSSFPALQISGTTITVGTADGGTGAGSLTVCGGLTVGVAGTTSGVITLAGSTSGTCTITAPATAGTVTNPIAFSNSINLAGSTLVYQANGTSGVSAGSFSAITAIQSTAGLVTTLTGTSDARLKDSVPYEGGLAEILKITPVRYTWNKKGQEHTGLSGDQVYVGFIAQDVQKAIPEAITATEPSKDGKETYLSFDDRPVVAALVRAIQQLTKRIEELEKR